MFHSKERGRKQNSNDPSKEKNLDGTVPPRHRVGIVG